MSIYKAICIALAGCLIVGCTQDAKHDAPMADKEKTLEVNSIVTDSELTPGQKAEKLARGAEELLLGNPAAFMFADEVLNAALNLDANNKRAQLYKVILGPAMTLRGITTRVMPLATADEIKKGLKNLKENTPKSTYDFLTEGAEDINNEESFQGFLNQQTAAYERARVFFKNNKDMKITLYAPSTMAIKKIDRQTHETYRMSYNTDSNSNWDYTYEAGHWDAKHCPSEKRVNGDIQYRVCNASEVTERTLEAGDIEALQIYFAALKINSSLANSYRLNGAFDFLRVQQELGNNKMGVQAGYKYLSKTDGFATLRDSKAFTSIKAMGSDAIKGVRYLIANQSTLCPKGAEQAEWWQDVVTRPGKLFDYGLCIDDTDETVRQLAKLESALKGEASEMKYTALNGELKSTTIKSTAIIDSPILDLKTLDPQFNPCGRVISVSDDSFGGVFVNNDANAVLWDTQEYCGSKMDNFIEENKERFNSEN